MSKGKKKCRDLEKNAEKGPAADTKDNSKSLDQAEKDDDQSVSLDFNHLFQIKHTQYILMNVLLIVLHQTAVI